MCAATAVEVAACCTVRFAANVSPLSRSGCESDNAKAPTSVGATSRPTTPLADATPNS